MEDNSKKIAKPPPETAVSKQNEKEVTDLDKATEMIKSIALTEKGDISKPVYKKPLTSEAIRALLEQRFQMIWAKEASDSNFLKYLFISKRFFNAAQRYPIFCLGVAYRFKDVLVSLMNLAMFKLPIIKEDFKPSKEIILSYQKIDSLLLMLKPNHFVMMLGEEVLNQIIKKTIGHLSFVHGKIALVFICNFQTAFSLLLDQFSRRKLEYLECSPDFLTRSDVKLKIGHYQATLPINNVQLQKILSHSVDSLICKINDNFTEQAEFLPILDHCNSLKWVTVAYSNFASLMEFLNVIEDKCSKLKELHVCFLIFFEDLLVFNADDILDKILVAQGQIWQVIEKCRPLTSCLNLFSVVNMIYHSNDEFPCDEWIGRAKKIDWFKDSNHEETIEQANDNQYKCCQLRRKFDDGFLELNHNTYVGRIF